MSQHDSSPSAFGPGGFPATAFRSVPPSPSPVGARRAETTWLRTRTAGLYALGSLALPGTLLGLLVTGFLGMAVGLLFVAGVVLTASRLARPLTVVTTLVAVLCALATGAGTWVSCILLGIVLEVLPFFMSEGEYPHEDLWMQGSGVLAFACGVAFLALALPGRATRHSA